MFYIELRTHKIVDHSIKLQLDNNSLLLYLDDERQEFDKINQRWNVDRRNLTQVLEKLKSAEQQIQEMKKHVEQVIKGKKRRL